MGESEIRGGKPFSRQTLDRSARTCLHKGKWCNADCWLVERDVQWVVKDFRKLAWPLRWTLGAWLARRECRFLQALGAEAGTPGAAFLVTPHILAMRHVPGRDLKCVRAGELPPAFFARAEERVRGMHARGIVHLDLRNPGNLLAAASGEPLLLDFQSALRTRWLPAALRRALERVDLSGIYKHWARLAPGTLGEARERVLLWQLRHRSWWRVRGYQPFNLRQRPLKDYERTLLDKYKLPRRTLAGPD